MNKLRQLPAKLLQSNRFLFVLSLIISFVIWFSFSQIYNPMSTRTLTVPVNFNTENTAVSSLGLEIVSGEDVSVKVRISGQTEVISSVTASDITVTPSLSNVTGPGEYEVTLVASSSKLLGGFDIISVEPRRIWVKFDTVLTRTFNVSAKAIGVSAPEGLIAEDATVTDSANATIDITGPQTELNNIASVIARAEVNKTLKETGEFDADILLLDADGNEMDQSYFTLGFTKCNITVAISRSKDVPVNVTFENAPATIPFSYSPSVDTITVIGPPSIIDSLESVSLSPINFGSISTENDTFTCDIVFPASVKSIDGLKQVQVTINMSGIAERTIDVSGFNAVNVPSGMTAALKKNVSVTIAGPVNVISSVTSGDLVITADLNGSSTKGDFTVSAIASVSGYDNIWVINKDYKALVNLS